MSKIKLCALCLALAAAALRAEITFEVLEFKQDPLNLKPITFPQKDMNADLCAMLRIYSDVPGEL